LRETLFKLGEREGAGLSHNARVLDFFNGDATPGDYTASVWGEDSVFDRGVEFERPTGRAAIAAGSSSPRAPPRDRAGDRAFRRLAVL
jgi:hypothetical protein